jgi:hypothetical protein
MRRRLREQRRMREALLMDLGALVFELQRQGRREPELLQAKAAELSAVDQEVRALAHALDAREGVGELVAAGVAGSCSNCGSLLSTDARYCSACGNPALGGERRDPGRGLAPAPRPPEAPAFPEGGRSGFHPPALGGRAGDSPDGQDSPGGRLGRVRGFVRRRNTDG